MYKILVVDDEWNMRNLIKIYLSNELMDIKEAENGKDALEIVQMSPYDLVILDIMLPDIDGWEVCSMIRKSKQIPILMLSARNDIKDRVHGLNIGADDYLVKPFAPEELVARVHALLRRQNVTKDTKKESRLYFDGLFLDRESREVKVDNTLVELTPKEYDLLFTVTSHPKRVFTRELLLDTIWTSIDFRDVRTVDTHVKNIREKLRRAGLSFNPIKTVWGVGYKFSTPDNQT